MRALQLHTACAAVQGGHAGAQTLQVLPGLSKAVGAVGSQRLGEGHTGASAIGGGSASFQSHSGPVTARVAAEVQVHGHCAPGSAHFPVK